MCGEPSIRNVPQFDLKQIGVLTELVGSHLQAHIFTLPCADSAKLPFNPLQDNGDYAHHTH
jgi:hypothetical protein